jgi:prolipoprotein diacylglyceryltransferase
VWEHEQWRHPSQIYLALACLLIFAILVWREKRGAPENSLFFLQGALYSAARFATEFTRDGASPAFGLTTAQWVCVVWGLFCAVKLRQVVGSRLRSNQQVPKETVLTETPTRG